MQQLRQSTVFGKRKEPHTVIIARGDEIRHFTVRPWLAAVVGSVCAAVAIGYLLATTYLVLRDDLIGASIARQARLQHAYEDRIAALRAQVDRITSRQLLDQQLMETKVSELIARQTQLTKRHGRLGPILDRAEGELAPSDATVPEARTTTDRRVETRPTEGVTQASAAALPAGLAFWDTRAHVSDALSAADRADMLFAEINKSLRSIENEQMDRVSTLAEDADRTADAISEVLEQAGLEIGDRKTETGIGGPLVPIDDKTMFDTRVRQLDEALSRLETVKKAATALPIHNPAPGYAISSSFGIRRDPLLGTPAMHAGLDFRVPLGEAIHAPGAGKVVKAGWNGGYGRMVEIEHEDGITTRFAHMSKIAVKVGDVVQRGTVVGKVGSSGRSTGPHLHYEVRREGTAIDPLKFIRAGRKVAKLM